MYTHATLCSSLLPSCRLPIANCLPNHRIIRSASTAKLLCQNSLQNDLGSLRRCYVLKQEGCQGSYAQGLIPWKMKTACLQEK